MLRLNCKNIKHLAIIESLQSHYKEGYTRFIVEQVHKGGFWDNIYLNDSTNIITIDFAERGLKHIKKILNRNNVKNIWLIHESI